MRPSILLIEANSSLLSSMEGRLADAGFRTRLIDDGHAARVAVEEDQPAIVVVGRLSDHLSRFEFCESLRRAAPLARTGIIVVLSRNSELVRIRCIESGADDCIVEPFGVNALLLRIQSLLRRSHPGQPVSQLSYAGLRIDLDQVKAYFGAKRLFLRPKEIELLKLFLEHPVTVISRAEISERTGLKSSRDPGRAVDTQVKLLRRALRAGGVPDLIRTVRTSGYLLSAEPPDATATSPQNVTEGRFLDQRDT